MVYAYIEVTIIIWMNKYKKQEKIEGENKKALLNKQLLP